LRLLIDENIPYKLAEKLLRTYPKSIYVLTTPLRGRPDKDLLEYAEKNNLIIITFDTDFADILTFPLKNTSRIILRINNVKFSELENIVIHSLKILERKDLKSSVVIISKNKIRIKKYKEEIDE
jgi:predicted nuclease of predicted toxin-antitoxin system